MIKVCHEANVIQSMKINSSWSLFLHSNIATIMASRRFRSVVSIMDPLPGGRSHAPLRPVSVKVAVLFYQRDPGSQG